MVFRAPLVMGLILGKLVEESFSQSMIIHDNNFFALLESPVVLLFFVLTFLSLSSPFGQGTSQRNNLIRCIKMNKFKLLC